MYLLAQSDWVVWDTTYINRWLEIVKSYIGPAVGIGIIAFAVIMGILICIRIVKHFTRG